MFTSPRGDFHVPAKHLFIANRKFRDNDLAQAQEIRRGGLAVYVAKARGSSGSGAGNEMLHQADLQQ